jgi:endogenous inhibitor of DNA gyrase (YacG/DUF329 family)
LGYKAIAYALSLSENTVKSFCRRNGLSGMAKGSPTHDVCAHCGMPLKQTEGAKARRFCSDGCRLAWWNAHPGELSTSREFVCQTCGKAFRGYGRRERKYCSRACYGRSRARQA